MESAQEAERPWNWVDEAVKRAGGPTKTAHLMGVSNSSVHAWKVRGVMPTDTEEARARIVRLAEATGVSRLALVGLAEPFRSDAPKRGKKRSVRDLVARQISDTAAALAPASVLGFSRAISTRRVLRGSVAI